jgi:hypothetical protein
MVAVSWSATRYRLARLVIGPAMSALAWLVEFVVLRSSRDE